MKNFKLFIAIACIGIFQISIMPSMPIYHFYPNIILLLVITYLIMHQDDKALWWLVLGGLILDIFSTVFFGFYSLQFVLIFASYRYVVRSFVHDPSHLTVLIIFCLCSCLAAIYEFITLQSNQLPNLPVIIIIQTLAGFVIYYLLYKVRQTTIKMKT